MIFWVSRNKFMSTTNMPVEEMCPQCGSPLGDVTTTSTGRQVVRCSTGVWNPKTKQTDGCDYVKWLPFEPQELEEPCPKCGLPLVLAMTKFGKKMKKCSTNVWNAELKKAEGCDYVEWLDQPASEKLDEACPDCGQPLVLFTTSKGKKMKKCSTSGWDRAKKKATGCTYVEWIND
jgi:ssDNA-binding Zn-finger/Zn-ribbon topoisomerase 1